MASIAYALSIQHFINSVGAKAGFASIIGLALLVLLFFTQSRETANLRRRADEAEQQLYQLQLHVDHLSRHRAQQAAAPAVTQTAGAPVAAPPAAALARSGATRSVPGEPAPAGAVATIPAAPAGVGAPALSSATRLIPLSEPDQISIRALRPSTNGDGEGRVGAVSDATVATPPPAPPPGPAPSTAAGGANGVARPPVVPMPELGVPAQSTPPPRGALPLQQQRPPARPPSRRGGHLGRPTRRISPVFFVLAAILVAAVVAVVLVFVSGSSSNSSSSSSSSASGASGASASSTSAASKGKGGKQHATAVTVTPSSVTLAVLNSTSTQGLAAKVMGKLTDAGYKGTTTQNAAETSLTSTIVGYTAPSARADALAVAKSLNLSQSSVRTASQGDRLKICGSATAACSTQVIVTLGSDLSQTG
jgi:hypothetical protein